MDTYTHLVKSVIWLPCLCVDRDVACLSLHYTILYRLNFACVFCCSPDEPAVPFRLTGSDRSSAGRLEVYRNDAWGAVHYNSVPDVPALVTVVCRQLGFDQGMSGQINVFKSPSSLQWDGLSCSGSEASVADCTTSGWTSNGDEISIACYKSDNGEAFVASGLCCVMPDC